MLADDEELVEVEQGKVLTPFRLPVEPLVPALVVPTFRIGMVLTVVGFRFGHYETPNNDATRDVPTGLL